MNKTVGKRLNKGRERQAQPVSRQKKKQIGKARGSRTQRQGKGKEVKTIQTGDDPTQ